MLTSFFKEIFEFRLPLNSNDKLLVICALVGGIIVLSITIGFVGQGNVRVVPIFWTEKVEQTVFSNSKSKVWSILYCTYINNIFILKLFF